MKTYKNDTMKVYNNDTVGKEPDDVEFVFARDIEITKVENKYIVKGPRGTLLLNEGQYGLLAMFIEKPRTIQVISEEQQHIPEEKLKAFMMVLVEEKIIVKVSDSFIASKTPRYFFRRFTRVPLPSRPLNYLCKILSKVNLKIIIALSIVTTIISVYCLFELVPYTEFSWTNTPRLFVFLLTGVFVGIFHEIFMGSQMIREGASDKLTFRCRILLGLLISIVINWNYLLAKGKRAMIKSFVLSLVATTGLCGMFSIIGYIGMSFANKEMAFFGCTMAIIGYSYIGFNTYPFLFKGDGYNIFCILTGISRTKSGFFRIVWSKIARKTIKWPERSKWAVYIIWGSMFTATIIFIILAFYSGIRLRI